MQVMLAYQAVAARRCLEHIRPTAHAATGLSIMLSLCVFQLRQESFENHGVKLQNLPVRVACLVFFGSGVPYLGMSMLLCMTSHHYQQHSVNKFVGCFP